MSAPAVLVMAKAPLPGLVKTRLEPVFSPAQCAELQAALIRRTAAWAVKVAGAGGAYLAFDPPHGVGALTEILPPGVDLFAQADGDLGRRLVAATAEVGARRRSASAPLLVVGVDTRLMPAHAAAALAALRDGADVAFGPSLDGGYYIAALSRPAPEVFAIDPAAWGGPDVLRLSLAAAGSAGLATATLAPERDLDTPADAAALVDDPEVGELLAAALGGGQ